MRKLFLVSLALLCMCYSAVAQQAQPTPQPLTFYYDYKIVPGKEDDFMTLIKTVGAPVRDKLMAEGVVLAWGMETPILRYPGGTTHLIWFSVANYEGLEKVMNAMEAQQAKLAKDEASSGSKMTTAQRARETIDASKTRDWLSRDILSGYGPNPPAGVLPFTRYNFIKVKPGKGTEYRQAWEKYNKPVYDKLVADGVVLAYGLATEAIKTDGDFTHFVWVATANMAGADKIGAAFAAVNARRTEAERAEVAATFTNLTDPDMSRSVVTKSRIFKLPAK